jgi:S-(hydroxymethyl)glutathione dehydrogenase/alcohol dehydrogenase
MSTITQAAIALGHNQPLVIEEVILRDPLPGELLIQMKASGLCHTDLSVMEGKFPHPLPAILGHEGAGIVLACGPGVTTAQPGDHVTLSNLPHCGHCRPCTLGRASFCADMVPLQSAPSAFTWRGGQTLPTFSRVASFAAHTVVRQDQVSVIPKDVPFESAALVACGVMTGMGAALNDARIDAGSTVVVVGMGSIGLNVLQAARLAKAERIIAVDLHNDKEAIARQFGATDFVVSKNLGQPLSQHLIALLGAPADFVFECVGNTALLADLAQASNPFYGVCLAVGVPPFDQQIHLPATTFYFGRTIRGTMIGDGNFLEEAPKIMAWYQNGEIELDALVSNRLPLSRINEGFDLMKTGKAIRSVIVY